MNTRTALASLFGFSVLLLSGCGGDDNTTPVSFKKDIQPLLKVSCLECHTAPSSEGYKSSGLAMSTYEELMKGTKNGPVIIPGQSLNSSLNRLAEARPGVNPAIQMPHGKVKLADDKLLLLRKWVDQGAKNN